MQVHVHTCIRYEHVHMYPIIRSCDPVHVHVLVHPYAHRFLPIIVAGWQSVTMYVGKDIHVIIYFF